MDNLREYEPLKQFVDIAYPMLSKQQKTWLERHWEDFNYEKAELEEIVRQEFGKVVKEISPLPLPEWILPRQPKAKNPEILDYGAWYDPQSKIFRIKITKFKLPNEKIMNDADILSSQYGCPHVFLDFICGSEKVHPRVKKFKEKYSVGSIGYPDNDCEHN